jgi:methylation protein EvaC
MKCDLCKSAELQSVLNLGQQPLANKYPQKDQFETEARFPLNIMFCDNCRNIQLSEKVSRELMFEDYFYLSSVNLGLVRHFTELAEKLEGSRFVVDIGSNDGILLAPLKSRGIKCLGIEPSINVSKIAIDNGYDTLCSFFDDATVEKVANEYGQPDVIVASSVFTHSIKISIR